MILGIWMLPVTINRGCFTNGAAGVSSWMVNVINLVTMYISHIKSSQHIVQDPELFNGLNKGIFKK